MRRWAAAWIALTLAAGGCGEEVDPVLAIELIDPSNGDNPAAPIDSGMLFVEVEEGGIDRCQMGVCSTRIQDGLFTLDVPIVSAEELTRIQARIEGGDEPLHGATPFFTSLESLGEMVTAETLVVRAVMQPAGSCVEFDAPGDAVTGAPRLGLPRRNAGIALRRNLSLVVGGEDDDGPTGAWDRWDHATSQFLSEGNPVLPIGAARGLAVTENLSLFVGDSGALVFTTPQAGPPVPGPVTLHADASSRSALWLLDETVAVVAGDDSHTVSWLPVVSVNPFFQRLGEASTNTLLTPRTAAAVAPFEDGLLVVGGAADMEPAAEIVRPSADGEAAPFSFDVEGRGGWLLASPSERAYLWIGRVLDDDSVAGDTVLLTGCPDACVVEAGPAWDDPRRATGARTAAGAFWLVGSGETPSVRTDRVLWSGDMPRIERGPDLQHGRAGASVVENASGVIAVMGGLGDDPASLRNDLELCLPSSGLDPF